MHGSHPLPIAAFAAAAERAVAENLAQLWRGLELRGEPPRWSHEELMSACTAVNQAAAPDRAAALEEARTILRRVAARRLASQLTEDLVDCPDATWRIILGERYDSLVHRCAPRTGRRAGSLGAALAADPSLREDLANRLTEWFRRGAPEAEMADLVEAVLVHHRTPARRA